MDKSKMKSQLQVRESPAILSPSQDKKSRNSQE